MQYLILFVAIISFSAMASVNSKLTTTNINMTQSKMEKVIRSNVGTVTGQPGFLQFSYNSQSLVCISDAKHDRMRIISAIIEVDKLTEQQKDKMLEANFHSALDARYGISNGILYAAYIHPLSSLTDEQILAALRQVSTLALTFGSKYTSGDLIFQDK